MEQQRRDTPLPSFLSDVSTFDLCALHRVGLVLGEGDKEVTDITMAMAPVGPAHNRHPHAGAARTPHGGRLPSALTMQQGPRGRGWRHRRQGSGRRVPSAATAPDGCVSAVPRFRLLG